MINLSQTHIILCAHGDKRGSDRDGNLRRVRDAIVKGEGPYACDIALLSLQGELREILGNSSAAQIVIVPMIFSDGYFYSQIEKSVAEVFATETESRVSILPPLCDWSELAELVDEAIQDGPLLLVAHGSKKSDASKRACERMAEGMSSIDGRSVDSAYLEEPPFAQEVAAKIKQSTNIVGLFMGSGLHGDEDWQAVLSNSAKPTLSAFTIGSMKHLDRLVTDKVRQINFDE